jgi:hypothetical protein
MKRALWALGVLGVLAMGACAHREPTAPAAPGAPHGSLAPYYPLAVGNRWTYQVNLLGERAVHSVEIVGRKGGFFVDSEGQELGVDGYGVRDHTRYLLRSPLEPGATWTNVVSASSIEHYTLDAVGERCSVPAGTFEGCVRVSSLNRLDPDTTLKAQFTFAPDVGLVRVRTVRLSKGKEIPQAELSLLKYELHPAP